MANKQRGSWRVTQTKITVSIYKSKTDYLKFFKNSKKEQLTEYSLLVCWINSEGHLIERYCAKNSWLQAFQDCLDFIFL